MQKQELNTKARKTNPKQKMKHPRCQVFESASEAMQVFAKLPIVRNRNCLKNALKCRCEPEPPYHKLWPLIQISDLQLKTRNPKNSKPSPRLQTRFAIEDLGLQPGFAHALFYRKHHLSLQAKTLSCNPTFARIRSPRISHVSSAANHKKTSSQTEIFNCNPKQSL